MGNCDNCYKKDELHIKDHPLSIDNNTISECENYLSFNNKHELNNAIIINKFVSRCLLNKLLHIKHNELKNKVNNFIKQPRYTHRTQEYYKNKLKHLLNVALRNKRIMGFTIEQFGSYLNNVSMLKERIKAMYVKYITESEMEFQQKLFACMIKQYTCNNNNNKQFNVNEFVALVKNDIDNMFNICLNATITSDSVIYNNNDSEVEANRSSSTENVIYNNTESSLMKGNESCLLNIFANSKEMIKMCFDKKLNCFIRKYYYQYVIKKATCVSYVNDYMQFAYDDIRSTLTDTNYTYIEYDSSLYHRLQDTIITSNNNNNNNEMHIQQKKTAYQHNIQEQQTLPNKNDYKKIKSHKTHHISSKREKYKSYKSRNIQSNINSYATNTNTHSNSNLNNNINNSNNYRYINSLFSGKSTQMASYDDTTNLKSQRTSMPYKAFSSSHPLPNKHHIYQGEYDKDLCLYSGHGVLYKRHSNTIYEGTFRYGKKSGIGIKHKELSDKKYEYTCGEWEHNKLNGYGYYIYINHMNIEIKEGYYINGTLRSGSHITLNEVNDTLIEVIKYNGTLNEHEQYDGDGSIIKETYILNKRHCIWENTVKYEYKGKFKNGNENGYGKCHKVFKLKDYEYEYSGTFNNGAMNGYGKIVYSENYYIKEYEGFFDNDQQFYLYGIVKFKSGDVYEGFFGESYQKEFVGLYQHYEDAVKDVADNFFGHYVKDKKNGIGRFYSPSSLKVLVGSYVNGEKNGMFQLISNCQRNRKELAKCKSFGDFIHKTEEQQGKYNNNNETQKGKMYYLCEDNEIVDCSDKPFVI